MPSRSVSQSLNALPPSTVLRDYVIESELGSGGFSIVYLARHHLKSDWLYAIKEFLPAELAVRAREGTGVRPLNTEARSAFEDGLRRFRDEAEQLRKFRNERYIVSCLNYFEENDTAYLVMDYDDGLPLSEFLRLREDAGQPFTEADLLAVVEPLLEGLAVVHRADVLHRDIKPGNIFVRRQDDITGRPAHPVLIDFGAAKQNYLERHSRSQAPYTPGYAAYEQISSGGDIGPWTDIYAVGALMWRMVAGGCSGDSRLSVADDSDSGQAESFVWSSTPRAAEKRAYALHRGRPDPMVPAVELGAGRFSPEVLAANDRCLALYPENRVQNCGELRTLLDMSVQSVAASPEQSLSSRVDQRRRRISDRRVQPDGNAVGQPQSPLRGVAKERVYKKTSSTRRIARLLASGAIVGLIVSAIVGYRHAAELPMHAAPETLLRVYHRQYADQLPDFNSFAQMVLTGKPQLIEDMAQYLYQDKFSHEMDFEEFADRSGLIHWRDEQPNWVEALVEDLWHRLVTDAEQVASIQEPTSTPVERDLDPSTGEPAPSPFPVGESADGQVAEVAQVLFALGVNRYEGNGVPEDKARAAEAFTSAAEQGHARSQFLLGYMYYNGEGVPQNYAQALQWYTHAAEQGIPDAQINLGRMYANGEGVPLDNVQAYAWASLASVDGQPNAVALRNEIARSLSETQLAEAQQLSLELYARIQNSL